MSVGTWRQRARLVAALELLAGGEPVGRVAAAVGYSTPSAFGAMFVRHMGTSPGRYFAPDRPRATRRRPAAWRYADSSSSATSCQSTSPGSRRKASQPRSPW